MYLGSTIFRLRSVAISLAIVVSSMGVKAADSGKSSGQSIIISTPKNGTAGADVNLLGTGKYGSGALGNGSLDMPNSFSSQNSLSGLMAPPAPGPSTVIRGGQIEDMLMLDQRKDWVFLSPEEYILGLSPREAAILQGSRDRNNSSQSDFDQMYLDQSLSPAARFYQSLIRQRDGNQQSRTSDQNQQSQNDFFGSRNNLFDNNAYRMQDSGLRDDFGGQNGDSSLTGVSINASRLQKALNSGAPANNVFSSSDFPSQDARNQSSSPFGLGQLDQSVNGEAGVPNQNDYVAQFKALLNPKTPATTPVPAPTAFGNTTTSAGSGSGLSAAFGIVAMPAQVKAFNPQWSNPALLRSTLPTVGVTADGQADLTPAPPTPAVSVMQPQTFAAPKRWF